MASFGAAGRGGALFSETFFGGKNGSPPERELGLVGGFVRITAHFFTFDRIFLEYP